MDPFIDYQRFIDKALRQAEPAKVLGIQCDLLPERIHGQIQLVKTFIGHELRATVGLCSLLHDSPDQMTLVAVILCDSENVAPVISPMTMPRDVSGLDLSTPVGEVYVHALGRAWAEVVNMLDEAQVARQYMLGFLAHCCLEWPEDGDDYSESLPLSEDGKKFAELASKAFECRV